MAITIGETLMVSDLTRHTARWFAPAAADGGGRVIAERSTQAGLVPLTSCTC